MSIKKIGQNLAGVPKLQQGGKPLYGFGVTDHTATTTGKEQGKSQADNISFIKKLAEEQKQDIIKRFANVKNNDAFLEKFSYYFDMGRLDTYPSLKAAILTDIENGGNRESIINLVENYDFEKSKDLEIFMEVSAENGLPDIRQKRAIPLASAHFKNAANYSEVDNALNVGDADSLIPELAHSQQSKEYGPLRMIFQTPVDLLRTVDKHNLEPEVLKYWQNEDSPGRFQLPNWQDTYLTPGTLEHDAHSVRELEIRQAFLDKYEARQKQQENMPKKFQLGGLSAFNNIDFSSFDSVLEAGRPMVGSILGDAAQADNPEMFTNQMVKRLGNQAAANSAEEYWTQERDKALALTNNNRVRKQIEKDFNKNKEEVMQNYTTTQGATNYADAQSGFADASGFLDLLSGLQFNTGGNLRSKLGYSDNSPYKSLGSIDIDGNVIDMSRTGKTLLATPDVGEPRELKPYSGTHVFPGATKVTETPIKAKGGKAKAQKWLNNYYQEGGQGAIGAQLEVGEVFATPDANIIDTAATEKHKDMVKDLVTDILGGADYVFSAMDRMKITRKEAENISFGLGGQLYKEGEIPEMPKEVLLSDLFKEGEDEVQIAEFVKRVRTKYPVTDKEDVFSKKANAGNKQSRGPLLSAVAFINEKKRGGNGAGGYASTYENKFNNGISTDANPIKDDISHSAYELTNPGESPTFQGGGSPLDMILKLIPFAGGIAQGIGQMGSARNNRRDITKLLAEDRELIKEQAASQRGFAGLATGLNLAGIVNQDPTVTAPQYDTTQLDSSIRKVPRTLFDFASARLAAAAKPRLDQLFANSGSFSEAVNLSGGDAAANASAIANLGISEVQQNIQMENNYRMQKQGYSDKQITADVAAANATRGNSNRLIAGAAGALSGGVTAQGTITNQEQSALRNNNYQQTQNTVNWRTAKNDAWTNIINNLSGGITSAGNSGLLNGKSTPDDGVSESMNPNTVQGAPEIPWESPDYFSLLQPTQTQITTPLPAVGMTPRPGVPTMAQQMYGAGYNQSVPGTGWTQDPATGGWFPPGWVK